MGAPGLIVFAILTSAVFAQTTVYWDTNGATAGAGGATPSGTWNTSGATNWNAVAAGTGAVANWVSGNDAVFSAGTDATGAYTITLGAAMNVGNLTFQQGTALITGSTLTFNRVGGSTVNVASGLNAQIASAIAGTVSLTKTGTGTLLINAANTLSGGTIVNAGTLAIDGNQVNNRLPASAVVTVNNGGTFEIRGVNAQSSSAPALFTVNTGGTLNIVSGASTYGGTDSHAHLGNLTLAGGTVNLSYSGSGTAYNNESAQLDGTVTVTADSTIQFGSGATTTNAGLALNGTTAFTVNPAVTLNVSAELEDRDSGANGFSKNGTGTMVLSGANSYTGATTVSAGVLNIQNASALGTTAAGTTVASGAALEIQNNITVGAEALSLAGTGVGSNGALRNISGTNSFAGNITLTAASEIQSDAGTLTVSGTLGGATQALTVDGAGNTTLNGVIGTTTGTLTKNGAGTLTLGAANTFTGLTTVSAGTLTYGVNNALSSGAVNVNGGTMNIATFSDTVGAVTLTNGSITGTTGVLTGTSYAMQNGTASATLAGAGVALTKSTSGTVELSGTSANTYTGATSIQDGTLNLNKSAGVNAVGTGAITVGDGVGLASSANLVLLASNQIADNAAITINADGRLGLGTFTESIGTIAGTGLIDLSTSGYLTVGANNTSSTFGGSLTGTGTLEKAGTGTLTFTSTINYAGSLNLSGGTLQLSSSSATIGTLNLTGNSTIDFAGTSSLNVGTLNLNGFNLTVINWANAADYFFATAWTGAVVNTTGAAPMNQVTFNGFTAANTKWQGYDKQVTPVPEPATYGAMLLGSLSLFFAWRRRRA